MGWGGVMPCLVFKNKGRKCLLTKNKEELKYDHVYLTCFFKVCDCLPNKQGGGEAKHPTLHNEPVNSLLQGGNDAGEDDRAPHQHNTTGLHLAVRKALDGIVPVQVAQACGVVVHQRERNTKFTNIAKVTVAQVKHHRRYVYAQKGQGPTAGHADAQGCTTGTVRNGRNSDLWESVDGHMRGNRAVRVFVHALRRLRHKGGPVLRLLHRGPRRDPTLCLVGSSSYYVANHLLLFI